MPLTAATVHFDADVTGTGWHDLIDSPDPGTSILIYKAYLMNGCWGNNWVILRLSNPLTGHTIFFFNNLAWAGLSATQVPWRYRDNPIVFESGWKLEAYSSAINVGGLTVDINYGIDTGYGNQPSDYHAALLQIDSGTGITVFPLVAAAPANKVRHVKSVIIANEDTVTHGFWSVMQANGGADPAFFWNMGNVASLGNAHFPFIGEGVTLDEDTELAINKGVADVTSPSLAYASWLEAGGYEDIGPSDTGPWTDSQQIIQRRSITLDGQLDRLMTHPTAAAPIGITEAFTLMCWVKPDGLDTDRQWIFMLGGVGNPGRIHLSRDTLATGDPWRIEIYEVGTTKKRYKWDTSGDIDQWINIAITFDLATDKLLVYRDGVAYTPEKSIDSAIGTLIDFNRYIGLGGMPTYAAQDYDGFEGSIWNAAAWSRVLSGEELAYLGSPYNSHYDLRASHGPYVAGTDLEHYYRPGLMYSPDLGKDFGLGGNITDMTFENHINDTDLVDDYPGKGLI